MTPGLFFLFKVREHPIHLINKNSRKSPHFCHSTSLLLQLSYKVQKLLKFKDRYSMSGDSREYSFNTLKAKQTTVTTSGNNGLFLRFFGGVRLLQSVTFSEHRNKI